MNLHVLFPVWAYPVPAIIRALPPPAPRMPPMPVDPARRRRFVQAALLAALAASTEQS